MRQQRGSVVAAGVLSALAACAWLALVFGGEDSSAGPTVLVDLDGGSAWREQLAGDSAEWPETQNPLKDFDADFLGPDKGFPTTTASAVWPDTKNPLRNFDKDFRASWKGWAGPENNVYKSMAQHYPYLETKLEPDQSAEDYPDWKGPGKEHNVYTDPGYKFPKY